MTHGHKAAGEEAGSNPFLLLMRNTVNPYRCPPGQADRKECCWRCGQRMVEKANAVL